MRPRPLCRNFDFNRSFSAFSFLLLASARLFLGCAKPADELVRDGDWLYANATPKVKYLGSEACSDCHRSIYQSYLQSEMGRSMSRLDTSNIIEAFPQTYEVFDSSRNFYYQMTKRDNRFFQREYRRDAKGSLVHERWMEAEYVIVSGNNLRMYFHDE